MNAVSHNQLYSTSFWSPDSTCIDALTAQYATGTQTLHVLSQFYKDKISLEQEYSRKLQSLSLRYQLDKYELPGTLKLSLGTLLTETSRLSENHSLQSRKIEEELYIPLFELLGDRKAQGKVTENKVKVLWKELEELKTKQERKSNKYEEYWRKICSCKTSLITLDQRERQRMGIKLEKYKEEMLRYREDSWRLVKEYNEKLNDWMKLWWNTCIDFQVAEEERIRFIKANVWEYANSISSSCLFDDQSAENLRVSLQNCSAHKDIKKFVNENHTGDCMAAPISFVDFAKNENKKFHVETTKKFRVEDIPDIKLKLQEEQIMRKKKKNPPPALTSAQETAFEYIGKSKDTFKELQEEAQKEAVVAKQVDINKGSSEPSSYKVMSDYSLATNNTSISSNDDSHSEKSLFENPLLQSSINSKLNCTIKTNDYPRSNSPLKDYLSGIRNGEKFRDSMNTVAEDTREKEKHKSFGSLLKQAVNENPKSHGRLSTVFSLENSHIDNVLEEPAKKTRVKSSGSLRKSKSQTNFSSKNINYSNLPSHSSEGYPVLEYCRAQYNYTAKIDEELSFKKRDILMILHKQPDGWWFAENLNTSDSGLAPSNYLVNL